MNELEKKPEIDFDATRQRIEAFLVTSNDMYILASNELVTLKKNRNAVVAFFADLKSSAYATWKGVVAREKFFTDQIDEFTNIIERRRRDWKQEQENIRRQREAELQREADAKAEAERKRLERNAKANERRGNEMNAEMYREAAANCAAPVIVIASSVPKTSGVTERKVWKAEVTNKQAFCAAAAADPELAKFITVDTTGLVRAGWRGDLAGVKFYQEETTSTRVS